MKNNEQTVKLNGKEIAYCEHYESPKSEENEEKYGWGGCFCCKRPIKDDDAIGTLYVHYTTMGVLVDTLDEIEENDVLGGSQGIFPVGSACAKKHHKKFIFVRTENGVEKKY